MALDSRWPIGAYYHAVLLRNGIGWTDVLNTWKRANGGVDVIQLESAIVKTLFIL